MKSRQIHDDPVTYLLVFEKGDEFSECMQRFAEKAGLSASHFTGLGAFSQVTLGFFEPGKMGYDKIEINEQVEVLALVGDVTLGDAHPKVHPHVIVGCRNGDAKGGHLLEARVWPTLEVTVTEAPAHLRRRHDRETGLSLIDVTV